MPASQDQKQVDLGRLIKLLLNMHPLNKLSEDDQMIVAGQIAGALQEAIRLSRAQAPPPPPPR